MADCLSADDMSPSHLFRLPAPVMSRPRRYRKQNEDDYNFDQSALQGSGLARIGMEPVDGDSHFVV